MTNVQLRQLQEEFYDTCKAIDYLRMEEKVTSHPDVYNELVEKKEELRSQLVTLGG